MFEPVLRLASGVVVTALVALRHAEVSCDHAYSVDLQNYEPSIVQNQEVTVHFCASSCASEHARLELVSYLGRGLWETCRTCLSSGMTEYKCDDDFKCTTATIHISALSSHRAISNNIRVTDVYNSDYFGLSPEFIITEEDNQPPPGKERQQTVLLQNQLITGILMGLMFLGLMIFLMTKIPSSMYFPPALWRFSLGPTVLPLYALRSEASSTPLRTGGTAAGAEGSEVEEGDSDLQTIDIENAAFLNQDELLVASDGGDGCSHGYHHLLPPSSQWMKILQLSPSLSNFHSLIAYDDTVYGEVCEK